MPRHCRVVVIGFAATIGAFVDGAWSAETETIVLQDEMRTAYYEHAPAHLASSMEIAVQAYCASSQRGLTTPPWLCAPPHHQYLRNVYLNGTKGPHGLVCNDAGLFKLKYFGVDLVADVLNDHTCLNLEYDGRAFHVVVAQARSGGDD